MLTINVAILKALEGKEIDSMALLQEAKTLTSSSLTLELLSDRLQNLTSKEWVLYSNLKWSLTWQGRDELARQGDLKLVKPPIPDPNRGLYSGAELKATCLRQGAYDFLKCPSLINGVRKPHYTEKLIT